MPLSRRLILTTTLTAMAASPVWAVNFLETFDGGVYSNGTPIFDDGDLPEGNDWKLENDALVLFNNQAPVTDDFSGNRFAMWEVPGLSKSAGDTFTLSTTFRVTETDATLDDGDPRDIGQVIRVGFAALGASSEANTAGEPTYYTYLDSFGGPAADEAQFTPAVILREFGEPVDTPRLNSLDDTGIDAFLGEPGGTTDIYFEADVTYTFSVEIEYLTDTSASFVSSITDGTTTSTQPAFTDEDLRDGDWFGLLGRKSSTFEGEIIFDSFSITQATETGLVGDYDDSGSVEQGDLNLVLNNWGLDAPFDPNGEAFADLAVNQEELNRVLNNWGDSAVAPSFEGSAVPEPASVALLAGLAALTRRRD
ncbi:MAG: hypothetical protein AAF328_09670 [Planctomycetota bacterium]